MVVAKKFIYHFKNLWILFSKPISEFLYKYRNQFHGLDRKLVIAGLQLIWLVLISVQEYPLKNRKVAVLLRRNMLLIRCPYTLDIPRYNITVSLLRILGELYVVFREFFRENIPRDIDSISYNLFCGFISRVLVQLMSLS